METLNMLKLKNGSYLLVHDSFACFEILIQVHLLKLAHINRSIFVFFTRTDITSRRQCFTQAHGIIVLNRRRESVAAGEMIPRLSAIYCSP